VREKARRLGRDSSVGIATGWTVRVRFSVVQHFSLLHSVETDSGAYPASYPVGTGAISPGAKRQGREADHLSLSSAEVKKGGAIPPLHHIKHRDFTFNFYDELAIYGVALAL
jgi:hypothetical protein